MRRVAPVVVAVVVVAVGVLLLRAETMSTHHAGVPGTRTDVVLRITTKNAEPSAAEADFARALVVACHLEVEAESVSSLRHVEPSAYHFTLQPALDESDRRQLVGCLQDARIDHVQGTVTDIHNEGP